MKTHVLNNEPLEEGWMVDRETGKPITDPADVPKGVLMPIGGYKGSGICLVMGLLGGPLNRAAFGRDVVDFNADRRPRPTPVTSSSSSTSAASCRSPSSRRTSTATSANSVPRS